MKKNIKYKATKFQLFKKLKYQINQKEKIENLEII